jgi:hypothetical protein
MATSLDFNAKAKLFNEKHQKTENSRTKTMLCLEQKLVLELTY